MYVRIYTLAGCVSLCMSFASKFGVKAAESDSKGLQSTEWEAVVHSEDLTGDLAKLEHHVVLCAGRGACIAQSVHCTVCVCVCVCVYSCLRSDSWTNWKFFTEACVTRPWKLRT